VRRRGDRSPLAAARAPRGDEGDRQDRNAPRRAVYDAVPRSR
jgi:hypothetical protein